MGSIILDREISIMKISLFSDGDNGSIPDGFSDWTVSRPQVINRRQIEFFLFISKIRGS